MKDVLTRGHPSEIVIMLFNQDILKSDLRTLAPGTWLNEVVINTYGQLILARTNQNPNYAQCHFFNSFFLVLLKQGYTRVRRWTKKVRILIHLYIIH